jgi:hypothetical protein
MAKEIGDDALPRTNILGRDSIDKEGKIWGISHVIRED